MSQSPPLHIWGLENRSLCDLFKGGEPMPLQPGGDVAICGPCVVAADLIREMKIWLIGMRSGPPAESPAESLKKLATSRWPNVVNLDAIEPEADWDFAFYDQLNGEQK